MKPPYSGVASHDLPTRNRECLGEHLLTTFCTFTHFLHVLTLFVISNLRLGARFGLSGCQILEAVVCHQFVVCPEPAKPPCDSLARTWVPVLGIREKELQGCPAGFGHTRKGKEGGYPKRLAGRRRRIPLLSPSSQSLLLLSHLLSRCTRKKTRCGGRRKLSLR